MNRSPWRVFAAACMIAAAFCYVTGLFVINLTDKNAAGKDFIQYWAAGRQLIHHADPYDARAILPLERSVGFEGDTAEVSPSPPVALFLALPFGYLSPKTGLVLWIDAQFACLAISLWILWRQHGVPESRMHLLGFLFAPAIACIMLGQLDIFFLLGFVLFLYFHHSRAFAAGAALIPWVLKPHLFVPFGIVLLLWIVNRKAWGILAGFLTAFAACCTASLCCDSLAWTEYAQMTRKIRVMDDFLPTLSEVFRHLIDRNAPWLLFLPMTAACVWALWYFWTRRNRWQWIDQGMLLILVSVACAPYAFFYDEVVLLPAVLAGLYRATDSPRSRLPIALLGGAALIEILWAVKVTSLYYLWTTPAWLGWYLYATAGRGTTARDAENRTAATAE